MGNLTIKPYINTAIEKFHKNFLKKEPCPTLFTGKKDKEKLFKLISKALRELFSLSGKDLEDACFKLGQLHHDMKIPFARLFAGFNFIKHNLYLLLAEEDKLDPLFEELEKKFSKITAFIAKGYIDSILKEFLDYFSSLEIKDEVISYHKDWLKELLRAAKEEEPFDFDSCELERWIESEDFELMCINNPVCQQIRKSHSSLHKDAKAFYQLYVSGNFFEALLIFKTLVMLSYRLLGDLQTLFTRFTSGKEGNLFAFAEKLSGKTPFFLISFNPKNLKLINRMYGTEAGDEILETIEKILRKTFQGYPFVIVRGTSGEVFILVKQKDGKISDLTARAKWRIESKEIEQASIFPKVSVVSVEIKRKLDKDMIRSLLNYAQREAVKTEDNLFFLTGESIDEKLLSKIEEEKAKVEFVSDAIKHKKIDIFFQPIVNLKTEEIAHYEVLARIKEKDKFIPAGAFIDLIHSLDLVVELDSAVLERALFYAPKMTDRVKRLFINISPKSIRSRVFVGKLKLFLEAIEDFNIDVVFELTEQDFLENIETVTYISNLLGVTFAVDDFGTGYSSIKSVIDLSSNGVISYIKVDGSLVRTINNSPETERIVSVITAMAKTLNLKTIAEFVENEEILKKVIKLGVDYGQGYYFSKPISVNDI